MSPNTVRKYITQLEDKRLIETLPTTVWTLDGTARNGTLLYTILPIHEAVNYHLERLLAGLQKSVSGKDDEPKLGPVRACVRFWGPGRGNDTSKAPDSAC